MIRQFFGILWAFKLFFIQHWVCLIEDASFEYPYDYILDHIFLIKKVANWSKLKNDSFFIRVHMIIFWFEEFSAFLWVSNDNTIIAKWKIGHQLDNPCSCFLYWLQISQIIWYHALYLIQQISLWSILFTPDHETSGR